MKRIFFPSLAALALAGCAAPEIDNCGQGSGFDEGRAAALAKAADAVPACASQQAQWDQGFSEGIAQACIARQAWERAAAGEEVDNFCLEFAKETYGQASDLGKQVATLKSRLLEIDAALADAPDEKTARSLELEKITARQELSTLYGVAAVRGWQIDSEAQQ